MILQLALKRLRIILSYSINFDTEALKNTVINNAKVNYTSEHSKLIDEISRVLCIIIQIPETAMKGIVSNAIREWQLKNRKTVAELAELPIARRLNAVKEIFHQGNMTLKKMLQQPKPKNEIILDIAFEKAFKHYLNWICQNS
ncbi:MAG: hypothetical protein ACFE9S_09795 [Candidatus Hermodarchaeota archaeon]